MWPSKTRGTYRSAQNDLIDSATGDVIDVLPPIDDMPEFVRDLVQWMNHAQDVQPVIASAIAPFQLVPIHPFLIAAAARRCCCHRRTSTAPATASRAALRSPSERPGSATIYDAIQSVRPMPMDMNR